MLDGHAGDEQIKEKNGLSGMFWKAGNFFYYIGLFVKNVSSPHLKLSVVNKS
ncbi:MAG: hypothetical protein ABH858_05440 [Candidatus Omnitrophota bacterium]